MMCRRRVTLISLLDEGVAQKNTYDGTSKHFIMTWGKIMNKTSTFKDTGGNNI